VSLHVPAQGWTRGAPPSEIPPKPTEARIWARCKHLLSSAYMSTQNPRPNKPVPVRLPADLCRRIDAVRGLVPREAFVRQLLDNALKPLEREQER
jgi:hypothetical protein